jgi:hypothetical protein
MAPLPEARLTDDDWRYNGAAIPMSRIARLVICLALAGVSSLDCGGSSAGGSCGHVESCGGDVVGSWSIAQSCGVNDAFVVPEQAFFAGFCDPKNTGVVFDPGTTTWVGSWSFSSAMSFTRSILITEHQSFVCQDGEKCSDLESQIQAAQASSPIQSGSCTAVGEGCRCTIVWSALTQEEGTYTSSGTKLLLTVAGASVATDFNYCVQGDTMHWIDEDNAPPTANADIVADRQ